MNGRNRTTEECSGGGDENRKEVELSGQGAERDRVSAGVVELLCCAGINSPNRTTPTRERGSAALDSV
jgi:hypothetical protein